MKLNQLCRTANIECPERLGRVNVSGIVSDSRQVKEGNLFVCLRGVHSDGHQFIEDAICRGAAAIVTEADFTASLAVAHIKAVNTRRALACLVDAFYGCPSRKMKFVAVTGTNGKTSVTHYLKAIFETAGYKCGLIGTVGCFSGERRIGCGGAHPLANMTTPDPEQLYKILDIMACDGVEYVFVEASSHALWLGKLAPIHFATAIFTNLTPDHLDFHGDMQSYLAAKKILFGGADISVVNTDSGYAAEICEAAVGGVVSCSAEGRMASYRAVNIMHHGCNGISYTLISAEAVMRIRCSASGIFNVMNTLEAAACALELGISPRNVVKAIASVRGVSGRLEHLPLDGSDISVFIDYAHTPDALEHLLKSVRSFAGSSERTVVLFGCGGDRDRAKRKIMGSIATEFADFAYITSDNSRSEEPSRIIDDILVGTEGRDNFRVITDREQAIKECILNARAGDIIVLAGKGHETYEIDSEGRHPFCEKDIVYKTLEIRRNKERT